MAGDTADAQTVRDEGKALIAALSKEWDRMPTQAQDTIAQALLLALGSGPMISTLDGLLAANAANSALYQKAVQNQQKTNLLGMAMTAKCVRYMLEPHDENIIDDDE